MNQRVTVTDEEIMKALHRISDTLQRRLVEKGRGSFISLHEIDGAMNEEILEWKAEVHNDDHGAAADELVDIAVNSVFGLASMSANARHETEQAAKAAPKGLHKP